MPSVMLSAQATLPGRSRAYKARLYSPPITRIVAVSDSKGAIFSGDGFDVESLHQNTQDTRKLRGVYCDGSVCELVEHETITNEELLELEVDVLIPAAL